MQKRAQFRVQRFTPSHHSKDNSILAVLGRFQFTYDMLKVSPIRDFWNDKKLTKKNNCILALLGRFQFTYDHTLKLLILTYCLSNCHDPVGELTEQF